MSTNPKQRNWQLFILITGSLVVLFMTYFSGMKAANRKARELDDRRKVAEQKYREAQRDLRVRLALTYQLEARRRLAMALEDMEKRNFGLAQDQVGLAAKLLEQAQASGAIVPDLTAAAQQLSQTSLTATENQEAQRTALINLSRQIDASLTEFVPPFLTEKEREDASNPIVQPTLNDVPLPPGKEVGRRSKE